MFEKQTKESPLISASKNDFKFYLLKHSYTVSLNK